MAVAESRLPAPAEPAKVISGTFAPDAGYSMSFCPTTNADTLRRLLRVPDYSQPELCIRFSMDEVEVIAPNRQLVVAASANHWPYVRFCCICCKGYETRVLVPNTLEAERLRETHPQEYDKAKQLLGLGRILQGFPLTSSCPCSQKS